MAGFNFVGSVVGPQNQSVGSAVVVAGGLVLLAYVAKGRLEKASDPLVPDEGFSAKNFGELLATFILSLGDTVMGKHNRKYLPFVGAIFLYIASLNLLGLIPGFLMPTDQLLFNFGMAGVVFLLYNFWGIKEVGIVAYLKHLCGPIWWIAPLFILIELISHVIRPISLSLRLFGNMTGDHLVLGIFTSLTKFGIPVIFYGLGTFVSLMQAFVFTLLTMIYIRFAVAHEEDH